MKSQADGHRRDTTLLVGQKVWVATGNLPLKHGARKLAARWVGPYDLVEQVSEEAWRVRIPQQWKVHNVFHSSQLKAVVGNPRVP